MVALKPIKLTQWSLKTMLPPLPRPPPSLCHCLAFPSACASWLPWDEISSAMCVCSASGGDLGSQGSPGTWLSQFLCLYPCLSVSSQPSWLVPLLQQRLKKWGKAGSKLKASQGKWGSQVLWRMRKSKMKVQSKGFFIHVVCAWISYLGSRWEELSWVSQSSGNHCTQKDKLVSENNCFTDWCNLGQSGC